MTYETLTVDSEPPTATVTLNRPDKHNAINDQMLDELLDVLHDVNKDDEVRAVIFKGAGDSFCSGADLNELQDADSEDMEERSEAAEQICRLLELSETVSVAAIHGNCLGGGLELAAACDFRIAAEDAELGQPEARLGLIPGFGGTVRLPKLIGLSAAKQLILTGHRISADKAEDIELVDRVIPKDQLRDEAMDLAESTSATSPAAYRRAKYLLHTTLDIPVQQGLELERRRFTELFDSHDAQEGIAAFLENREPSFEGR